MKNYETEARERWGDTDAYRKHEQKQRTTQKKSGQRQTMARWRVLPILPHVRIAVRVPILSKHRRLLSSCRRYYRKLLHLHG